MVKKDEIIQFSDAIEEIVYMYDVPYMEAILMHCENTGLEVEMAAKLISDPLEEKIKLEAEGLKLMRKANTSLPL